MAAFLSGCSQSAFEYKVPQTGDDSALSPSHSTMSIAGPAIADGMTPAIVTLTLKNRRGAPLVGKQMNLSVTGSQNVVVPCSTSNSQGVSQCRIYTTYAESKWIELPGFKDIRGSVMFTAPVPQTSLYGVVSSSAVVHHPSGRLSIVTVGISEDPTLIQDGLGNRVLQSSALGRFFDE